MNCKDIKELLNEYIDNELTQEQTAEVKAHLDGCDVCKKELEELVGLHNNLNIVLKTVAGDVIPPDSLTIIKERAGIEAPPVKKGFWGRMSAPAGVALSLFLVLVSLVSFVPFMAGSSGPPPRAPFVTGDENGGAYIVWLDGAHQKNLRVQHINSQGDYPWGEKGKEPAKVYASSCIVNDGSGGIIISWRNNDGTYLERLDASGDVIWILENFTSLKLRAMASDGSGNIFLLLYDNDDRIYVQKISEDGSVLWNDGILLGEYQGDYDGADIVSDNQGGAVVLLQEQKNRNVTLRVQRIDSYGELVWMGDGVIITSMANCYDANPQIVGDGTGSFIVAWDTGSSGFDNDVYVQKLDSEGNPLWGKEGINVCENEDSGSNALYNVQSNPQIVADGTGGAIVTWHDRSRIGNGEVFAQKISADGEILWQENGVWVWDIPEDYPYTAGILDSDIIFGEDGSAIIVWTGYESLVKNTIVYAQKINQDGELLWLNGTVYNNPDILSQGYSNVISDGNGGVIIVSRAGEDSSLSNTHSIYAQHIDSQGNLLWGEGGLVIQRVSSSPVVLIIALVAIIIAGLIIYGLYRGNKLARLIVPIGSLILFFMGIYCLFLIITTMGTNVFEWSYVLGTPLNWIAIWVIILSGLALAILGVKKAKITKWVSIPVFIPYVLWAVVAVIQGYWLLFGAI